MMRRLTSVLKLCMLLPQPPSSGSFRRGELKRCIRSNFEASASIEPQDWPGLLDQVSLIAHCPIVAAGCPLKPVIRFNFPATEKAMHIIDLSSFWRPWASPLTAISRKGAHACRALMRCGSCQSSSCWSSAAAPPPRRVCMWRSQQPPLVAESPWTL